MDRYADQINFYGYYVLIYLVTSGMFYAMLIGLHEDHADEDTSSRVGLLLIALFWPLYVPLQILKLTALVISQSGSQFVGKIIRYLTKEK